VLENPQAPAPMDVVQRVTDLPAGALVAPHTHPGPNFNLLLQGQLVLDMHGMAHTYQAGDNWVEPADVVHDGRNTGATTARIMGSALVPRGAPVVIPAQQPAVPAAQPKPGAPKPGPPAAPAQAPKPVASPAAAPAQAPRALPRTGDAENWAIGGLAVAGLVLLGAGMAARRRSF
jgi:LPXTG-motif cell wall-anchored protein